jgi:hypothetical protein
MRKKSGYRRERAFSLRKDDETLVPQSARVLGILALMRLTRGNTRVEFVNRDFHAATCIR